MVFDIEGWKNKEKGRRGDAEELYVKIDQSKWRGNSTGRVGDATISFGDFYHDANQGSFPHY